MNKCAVRSLNLQRVLDPWVWRSSTRGDCRAAHTPTPCCRSGPAHRSAWWRSCCWSFDSLPFWPPLHWTTATTTARYQDISKDNLLMFYHRGQHTPYSVNNFTCEFTGHKTVISYFMKNHNSVTISLSATRSACQTSTDKDNICNTCATVCYCDHAKWGKRGCCRLLVNNLDTSF